MCEDTTNVGQLKCDCDKVAQSNGVLVLLDYLAQVTRLLQLLMQLLLLLVSPAPFTHYQFDPHMFTGLLMYNIKYFFNVHYSMLEISTFQVQYFINLRQ